MRTFLLITFLSLAMDAPAALTITDPGQDVFDFTASAAEPSGLAWLSGSSYFAVSDDTNQRKVYELSIGVNPANGRITCAARSVEVRAPYLLTDPARPHRFLRLEVTHP